ncbi:MAG: hypothetical protein O3A00_28020, partial [Planctomycetota bacterium]|nr:hypothetical protein [Planctomycetota bacterium]
QDAGNDASIGSAFQLNQAVMVDVDPEGTLGTQIFANEISLSKGGQRLITGRPTRFYSRWVLRRNLGTSGFTAFAATWHAVVMPDVLTIGDFDSPVMQAFRDAKINGLGLFVRFCTYVLAPRISQSQLASDFAQGRTTSNPAYGQSLGTVGTWQPGTMQSLPQARRLGSAAQIMHDHTSFQLNPAPFTVDTTKRVVSVDMINAVPEMNESLEKVNVGPLALFVRSPGDSGEVRRIGPIKYDRIAYESQGGMVDIPFTPDLDNVVAGGDFEIRQDETGAALLTEVDTTIETDDRGIYIDAPENQQVRVRVLHRGKPTAAGTKIELRQFVTTNRTFVEANDDNAVLEIPSVVDVGSGGDALFTAAALRPGTCLISFSPYGETTPVTEFFTNVRVLPEDNYDHVSESDLTYQLIYDEVLRYYHLLYPAMSNPEVFELNVEFQVIIRAQPIRERIVKELWDRWEYMPRTRELSAGKRKLLTRWSKKISPPS